MVQFINIIGFFYNLYCFYVMLLYITHIYLPLLTTYLYMFKKSKCIICYNYDYIYYQRCNKPYRHTVCYQCYFNPHYDRSKCHLCQLKFNY